MFDGVYEGETIKRISDSGEEIHVRHGQGCYTYGNSSFQYRGSWVNGVKHGHGTFHIGHPGGVGVSSVYEGDFRMGEMTGHGTQTWSNGSQYTGEFIKGAMHGAGVWQNASGDRYEGSFQDGRWNGQGRLTKAASAGHQRAALEYVGEFVNSQRHGKGTCRWDDQSSYEGEWSLDMRSGDGREHLPDGSSYVGRFRHGQRHGLGKYTHAPSGIVIDGNFKKREPPATPTHMRIRVTKQPEHDQGPAGCASTISPVARSSARPRAESPGAGTSKLSKKKQEELRKQQEEWAAYRATLTEGFVQMDDGSMQAVIDEGMTVKAEPGHKLPVFFLCLCNGDDGSVCASESGRTLRISLRATAANPAAESAAPSARSQTRSSTLSTSTSASSSSTVDGESDEDVPILAFCTCDGARTLPWTPPPKPDPVDSAENDSENAAVMDEKKRSGSAGQRKKLGSAGKSGNKTKKPTAAAANEAEEGPPPPFVCNGSCVSTSVDGGVDRSSLHSVFTRVTSRGFVQLDELWLSGACSPASNFEIVVEDVTQALEHQHEHDHTNNSAVAHRSNDRDAPPIPLSFRTLPTAQLKCITGGVPVKKSTKKQIRGKPTPTK